MLDLDRYPPHTPVWVTATRRWAEVITRINGPIARYKVSGHDDTYTAAQLIRADDGDRVRG